MDVFRTMPQELNDPALLNRIRLAYEFVAELTQVQANPAGLGAIVEIIQPYYRAPLAAAFEAGEITLPLGLDRTAELCARLYWGTLHWLFCDHDMIAGMGVMAGLKSDAAQ
jgi:hypothetical protein